METAFSWIQKIFDVFFAFFPTRVIVRKGYKLLKFKWSGKVVEKKPGLRWYFPLLTSIEEVPVARQAINDLFAIKFLSDNNSSCIADASCVYTIVDPIKYHTRNFDTANMLNEIVSASLCSMLTGESIENLKDLETINKKLFEKVNEDTAEFGIKLEYVRLNNLTTVIPFVNVQG